MTTPAIQNRMVAHQSGYSVTPMAVAATGDQSINYRPKIVDIYGYAGDTLTLRITVTDPSLVDDGEWAAQVRQKRAQEPVSATFVITMESETVALLTLPAATTAALQGFKGQWDCQVTQPATPTDVVRTLVQGAISFDPDVTRP